MWFIKPGWQNKNRDKAINAVEKITDQQKLIQAAKEALFEEVRVAAIKKLDDQSVLAEIAQKGRNNRECLAAVNKLTDQTLLAEIVKSSTVLATVEAAIEKLTDQTLLAAVVKSARSPTVSIRVVNKLNDQTLLAEIAKNDPESRVRGNAVRGLTSQTLLTEIAHNDQESNFVRLLAALKLTDQSSLQALYAAIAMDDSLVLDYRLEAARMLTDQSLLGVLAKSDKDLSLCEEALQRLTDQDALAYFVKNSKFPNLCAKALEKIINKNVLADIAINCPAYLAGRAFRALADKSLLGDNAKDGGIDQSVFGDIAKDSYDDDVRKMAFEKLTEQSVLIDVAKNGKGGSICIAAVEKLADQTLTQELYAHIAKHGQYFYNGRYDKYFHAQLRALSKLTSQSMIADVAKNANYGEVRIEAMSKCGLICEDNNHQWVIIGQCHKKCTVCGVGVYSHNYVKSGEDGPGAQVGYEFYECTKCGLRGEASGAGSTLLNGYFLDDDNDSRNRE